MSEKEPRTFFRILVRDTTNNSGLDYTREIVEQFKSLLSALMII